MTKIKDTNVLITGGAMGLGKLMAGEFLKSGAAKVVLWDINEKLVEETAEEYRKGGFDVITDKVDVSSPEAIEKAAAKLEKAGVNIDILVNNAGIIVGKLFVDHSSTDIERTVKINISGPMHLTRVFLPGMIERKMGHIVNMASAAGMVANPKMSVYASSKWAVIGWSESLRLELKSVGRKLRVTTVMPGYVDTGMFDGVKPPLFTPVLKPADLVHKILRAVKNDEVVLMAPAMVKTIPLLKGLLPKKIFDFVAGNIFGVYNTMDDFKGSRDVKN